MLRAAGPLLTRNAFVFRSLQNSLPGSVDWRMGRARYRCPRFSRPETHHSHYYERCSYLSRGHNGMRFTEMRTICLGRGFFPCGTGGCGVYQDAGSDPDCLGRRGMAQYGRDWHAQRGSATLANRTVSHIQECLRRNCRSEPRTLCLPLLALPACRPGMALVSLSAILADHMVFQRDLERNDRWQSHFESAVLMRLIVASKQILELDAFFHPDLRWVDVGSRE